MLQILECVRHRVKLSEIGIEFGFQNAWPTVNICQASVHSSHSYIPSKHACRTVKGNSCLCGFHFYRTWSCRVKHDHRLFLTNICHVSSVNVRIDAFININFPSIIMHSAHVPARQAKSERIRPDHHKIFLTPNVHVQVVFNYAIERNFQRDR